MLPKGLQRVRDYGFLRGNVKALRLLMVSLLLSLTHLLVPAPQPTSPLAKRKCPCCQHEMICTGVTRTS
ncbi:hypothetical protein [Psychrobium sp. 1_MG-2023]|uniref:hypothetical protein n=1 Tax=Psychrobium sp. 1_MG-2023 TaxID=3062624 RepID=UPI00351DC42C